jgi:hypothetical protein
VATEGASWGRSTAFEAAWDRQATAFSLGSGNELGQQVGGANDGMTQLGLEMLELGLQVSDLLVPVGKLLLEGRGIEIAKDKVGFAVETLAADAAVEGVAGDVAACAEEDSGGAGKAIGMARMPMGEPWKRGRWYLRAFHGFTLLLSAHTPLFSASVR